MDFTRSSLKVLAVWALSAIACGGDSTDPDDDSAAVASIELSLEADTLESGTTTQLMTTLRDAEGNVLTGRPVTWTSADDAVATVSASGLVTGADNGVTTIQATAEGVIAAAQFTVYVGVTGSWDGTLLAGALNCAISQHLDQELDGTINGLGTIHAPCQGSFVLVGMLDAGGTADSVYLYWNGSSTADVILGGHFDGADMMGGYLDGAGCAGLGCPVSLTRTSVSVIEELQPRSAGLPARAASLGGAP